MPGPSNSDNKFGPSSFVVGTVLGNGCNYTSIQSAINDAVAAGNSAVVIRAGTYTENISLAGGVDLLGVAGDGRPPTPLVNIVGNHTFTSNGFSLLLDIGFSAPAGDVFVVTAPGAGFSVLGARYCRIDAPGGRAVNMTGTAGGAAFIGAELQMTSDAATFVMTDAALTLESANVTSNNDTAIRLNGVSTVNAFNGCVISGNTASVTINSALSNCVSKDCTFSSSSGPSFLFNAAGTVANTNTIHDSSGASLFYVEGAGVYQYASDYLRGNNEAIDPLTTVSSYKWKPYSTAGTTLTGVRGTASFDSTQFQVVDGFVQALAGAGALTWIDRPVSTAVAGFTGNAVTASSVTLTLPTSPANGTECDFLALGANVIVVQAGGANIIRLGNSASSAGGTITSTALGDSVRLVYMASSTTWCSIGGVQGNWGVA